MSLRNDFCNYYRGTYIAVVQADGKRLPFYVEDVVETRNYNPEDYSDAHRDSLQFQGQVIRSADANRGEQFSIMVSASNLQLESPDIGYTKDNRGNVRWVCYKPSRNRLKGIHSHKLMGFPGQLTLKSMYRLFNPEFDGLVDMHTYIQPNSNIIYYKGVAVGKVIDGVVNLLEEWAHLASVLPNYRVTVVRSLEFPTPPRQNPFGESISRSRYRPRALRSGDVEVAEESNNPFEQPAQPFLRSTRRGQPTPNGEPRTEAIRRAIQEATVDFEAASVARPTPMDGESLDDFGVRLAQYYRQIGR